MAKRELEVPQTWALVTASAEELKRLYEVNIAGPINLFMLDRIKLASSGLCAWQYPGPDGKIEPRMEFSAIIVDIQKRRALWHKRPDEGGGKGPPQCTSNDCIRGYGSRTPEETPAQHDCLTCSKAAFGSAKNRDGSPGRGQACSNPVFLFVLEPEAVVPSIVSLPATSLKALEKYLLNTILKHQRCTYFDVVTRFGVDKATNPDGQDYGVVNLSVERRLTPEESKAIAENTMVLRKFTAQYQPDFTEDQAAT